jgi:hypothetical protein
MTLEIFEEKCVEIVTNAIALLKRKENSYGKKIG